MTTSIFIRAESNPAFEAAAQIRRVADDGVESTEILTEEETELTIHSDQYLKIVEFDVPIELQDEGSDADEDGGNSVDDGISSEA